MTWALVTGSSKGIGAAIAVGLAADGHDVIVHYGADEDGARAVATRCEEHGSKAIVVGADLRTDCEPLLDGVADAGGIGVLVNNAGVTADGLAMTMSDEDFALTWQVNVAAAFTLTRGVLRGMLRARAGRVVNLSSVVGLHGNAGPVNYAASTAALIGMTKPLARWVGKGLAMRQVLTEIEAGHNFEMAFIRAYGTGLDTSSFIPRLNRIQATLVACVVATTLVYLGYFLSGIIEAVAERTPHISKKDTEVVVNTIFDSMASALRQGERIEIRGFGSFQVKVREAREGRNPKTGEPVHISAKRTPFFKVGKELKEMVDKGRDEPSPPSGS